jgi:hypothetical protein
LVGQTWSRAVKRVVEQSQTGPKYIKIHMFIILNADEIKN